MTEGVLHERWYEYANKELNTIKEEKCNHCLYSKKFGNSMVGGGNFKGTIMVKRDTGGTVNVANIFCDYLSMTGEKRGCRPEVCDKFKEGKDESI